MPMERLPCILLFTARRTADRISGFAGDALTGVGRNESKAFPLCPSPSKDAVNSATSLRRLHPRVHTIRVFPLPSAFGLIWPRIQLGAQLIGDAAPQHQPSGTEMPRPFIEHACGSRSASNSCQDRSDCEQMEIVLHLLLANYYDSTFVQRIITATGKIALRRKQPRRSLGRISHVSEKDNSWCAGHIS